VTSLFTAWTRSRVALIKKGDRVRFRGIKKNWYQGRCSVALTGDSVVEFPEQEAWFEG
jgi:hypothetical protein